MPDNPPKVFRGLPAVKTESLIGILKNNPPLMDMVSLYKILKLFLNLKPFMTGR
ncbi:MAG: hypothetical protein CM15mP46_0010 [Alphaproteobacteria bacterium]|nr:MAG: hypothetical protein CM15mP46_0010 [Alphaproteobacteria bacterium]